MSLNTAAAIATLRALTVNFDQGVEQAMPVYPEFCTVIPSKGADEQYGFLGAMPRMKEWLGDRQFETLRAADFTIKNKKWEDSLRVEKDHIDDDRMGMYGPLLGQLGAEAAHHPDELLFDLIANGHSQVCYDAQYFFDTDHAWGDSGTQSNDLTYNAADHTAVTEAEFRAAYHAARSAMLGFKRDNGTLFMRPTVKPLSGLVLLVPTALELVATQAVNKQLISGGETNIILDRPRIVTCGYLTNSAVFYLLNLDTRLKPFVFQARKPLTRGMKGLDDHEFKDVKFMCDARYNVGYGLWSNAVRTEFN